MLKKLGYATLAMLIYSMMILWMGGFGTTTAVEIFVATLAAAMLEPWVSEQIDG